MKNPKLFLTVSFLFLIFFSQSLKADGYESFREHLNTQDVVILGPDKISLKGNLTVTAERVIVKGLVVTNGYALTIYARNLEFMEGSTIMGFDAAADAQTLVPSQAPAESAAPEATAGGKGKTGGIGGRGNVAHPQPAPIQIYAGIIVGAPVIIADGQQGGSGGQGQSGQPGQQGGSGKRAQRNSTRLWHDSGPGNGAQGGEGGDGGPGGVGAAGGKPLPIEIHYGKYFVRDESGKISEEMNVIKVSAEPGKPGDGGAPGPNGAPGPGGLKGAGASSYWQWSGTAELGLTGPANNFIARKGELGPVLKSEARVEITSAFSSVMESYLKSEVLVQQVNNSIQIDSVIQNLNYLIEQSKVPAAADDFQENYKLLQSRLKGIEERSKWLSESSLNSPEVQRALVHQQNNANLFKEVNKVLKLIETNPDAAALAVKDLEKVSDANLRKVYEDSFVSMQSIVKEILDMKDPLLYKSRTIIQRAAYLLYGPKALEEEVLNKQTAGALDDFELLHKIETDIDADPDTKSLVKVKKVTDLDLYLMPGVNDAQLP